MALGYQKIWTLVFDELGLDMDDAFASSLKARNVKKGQKRTKYEVAHQVQKKDERTGKMYGSDVALATATKKATQKLTVASCNPK